ncbi:MAG: signal peptidase II [Bdellovibrionaceae bacterium]|nr:signal peptidase II [Pseudobdellovibrionaceae bacterium]
MESKYLLLALIACALVALDQLTKMYVHSEFGLGESVSVIPNFFNFTYVRNPGAAFGFLRDAPETLRTLFFLSVSPVAMIIILFILKGVESSDKVQVVALSSIFGGALGNYIDRLRFGYVIDFLDFHYKNQWNYPAFNIADSAIVCGVTTIAVLMVLESRAEKKAKS